MLEEKQKVEITGTSKQTSPDGEIDHITWTCEGLWSHWEGGYSLAYKEGEESGLAGTFTTISGKEGQVFLLRTGQTHCEFRFIQDESHGSLYHTPYGDFQMVVQTRHILENFSSGSGQIRLEYALEIEGAGVTEVIFQLDWKPLS